VPGSLPERSEGTGTRRSAPHSLPSEAREGTLSITGARREAERVRVDALVRAVLHSAPL